MVGKTAASTHGKKAQPGYPVEAGIIGEQRHITFEGQRRVPGVVRRNGQTDAL